MIDIIIATRNKNKIKEIKVLLGEMPLNILSLDDGDWQIPDIVEDGKTFKENAIKKARTIAELTSKVTMADDSGLMVDALNGQPGIYSARFAGENPTDRENNLKLLQLMNTVPSDRRGAQFVSAIAVASPQGRVDVVEGVCRGDMGFTEEGGGGFGYDPIFIPTGYNKTFAELSISVKNKISHRGRALEKAKLVIERILAMSEEMSKDRPRT